MPATTPPPSEPHSHGPTAPARAVWPLLILALALVILLIGAGLAYLTWRHPSLGAPLGTAFGGVTLLVTLALALYRR
ncbi:hypothetical protein [Streptomyces sp. NPDC004533]|uniref:hypothetical protein n=1 Tax=Streptomyces sp. NPDC004533 TaxID=3154278 RepID=UPI0033A5575F